MKICLDETWESFGRQAEGREIVLFGASSCADMFLNKLKHSFKIKYLVDNDERKIGKMWNHDVFGPEKLKESVSGDVLLITSAYYSEIMKQLGSIGFQGSVYSFLHLRNKVEEGLISCHLSDNIEKLKDLMYDIKSKQIIDKIYQKRISGVLDFSDIEEGKQYFLEDIIKKDKNAVFVDGGCYDGETVRLFIDYQDNCFQKIYSFEMDTDNFTRIDREQFDSRVAFLNYGLWDRRETVSFISHNRGSEIAEEGNSTAECIALDDIVKEKITFIKMDIEGAEQRAILGAKRIITEDKPQLAICLYHKFADLWEIAFMLHDMVPEYKFFIRHHSPTYEETVLYAVL